MFPPRAFNQVKTNHRYVFRFGSLILDYVDMVSSYEALSQLGVSLSNPFAPCTLSAQMQPLDLHQKLSLL